MTRLAAPTLALLMTLTAACGDDDARVITVDAGTGTTDGGGGDAGGGGMDSGTPTDAGPGDECPPVTAPLPAGMVCGDDTLTCLMTATSADAQTMCLQDDPNAMCESCVEGQILNCATAPGRCDAQFAAVLCCTAERCGDLTDPAMAQMCVTSNCGSELSAFQSCFLATLTPPAAGTPPTCGITSHCFGS